MLYFLLPFSTVFCHNFAPYFLIVLIVGSRIFFVRLISNRFFSRIKSWFASNLNFFPQMQWYLFQGQRSRDYLWRKLALGNFIVKFRVKELDENGRQNEVDESSRARRVERADPRLWKVAVISERVFCGSSSTFLRVIEHGTKLDIITARAS